MWHRFAAWWRGWRYHWSPVTRLEPVRVGEGDPRFGSMQLDEDWPGGSSCSFLPAEPPRLPDADMREQMLAELSPEALERLRGPEQPQEARAPIGARCSPGNENGDRDADSGPGGGVSSLAPGPAPALNVALPGPGVGDGIEWAVNAAIGPHVERLADTGDIRDAGLLADITAYMRDQDADVADWLAGRAMTWARLSMAEALA